MTCHRAAYALFLCSMGTIAASAAEGPVLQGFGLRGDVQIPLDGAEVSVPFDRRNWPEDVRFVLVGTFRCAYNGRTYDAVYASGEGGAFDQKHSCVRWSPSDMKVIESDPSAHRYVLEPVGGLPLWVTARVDVDQFVTDLIITPSQVRQSLSGDLRVQVWTAHWGTRMNTLVISFLVVGSVCLIGWMASAWWRARQRIADVTAVLARIERKHAAAVAAVSDQREGGARIRQQLGQLRDGARQLAGHIAAFRKASATVGRQRLQGEIAEAEQQLAQSEREDVRRELESTLESKRRLRDLLADAGATQQRYLLRLQKIEAAIDTTVVSVTGQDKRLADQRADEKAIAALERELTSLDEAIEELKLVG